MALTFHACAASSSRNRRSDLRHKKLAFKECLKTEVLLADGDVCESVVRAPCCFCILNPAISISVLRPKQLAGSGSPVLELDLAKVTVEDLKVFCNLQPHWACHTACFPASCAHVRTQRNRFNAA